MKPILNILAWAVTAIIVLALWPFFGEDDGLGRGHHD